MPDDILIRFSVKDDGTPVIQRVNEKLSQTKKESNALVPGLENARRSLTGFIGDNASLIGILAGVGVALKSAFNDYAKLAEGVRDFSLVTGQSAEQASRFIQVLDDYQLTVEDATTASRFLKEKGLVPNIDTLVMLADKFKQIEDPAKRLEFIQENLGRGGAKWVNVLNQEGDALREAAGAIDEHLILSDKQIAEYEQQRLALDALSDTVQGWKVSLGGAIGEVILYNQVLTRAREITEANGGSYADQTQNTKLWQEALAQATAEQEAQTQAMLDNGEAAAQNAEDLDTLIAKQKELSDFLSGQISLINNIQSADEAFTEKSKDLAGQRAEAEAKLAELRAQGWWEQSQNVQDAIGDIEDIKQQETDLAAEREKQTLQFISNILAEQLARDGWTQAEFDAFAKQQEAWGLWSADVVSKAQAAWQEADRITQSINAIPTDKTVTITVQQLGGYDPGTTQYDNIAYAGRDAGGPGFAGQPYMISPSAAPEMFIPSQSGTFVPNADKTMVDYKKFALTLRDVLLQVGR